MSKASRVQSVVFLKKHFTKSQAISWVREHKYVVPKVDVTKSEYRIRQYSPKHLKVVGSKSPKKGIRFIIALPKKGYHF